MLAGAVIKRLVLSRYLFGLAVSNGRLEREVAAFACINMLQDAIEIFLVAAADHLNAGLSPRTDFTQYLDKINDKLSPDELPFRRRLIEINEVRIASKHDGVRPDKTELTGYVADARSFFQTASTQIFGVEFWTISLIHLLEEGEIKSTLNNTEFLFREKRYYECIIECRKAFYLEFETNYGIRFFKDGDPPNALISALCRAPYYAKNRDYIEKNVKDPFDYILLDHARVDAELAKMGIDNGSFWNIWRLTPEVYRFGRDEEWLVMYDPLACPH